MKTFSIKVSLKISKNQLRNLACLGREWVQRREVPGEVRQGGIGRGFEFYNYDESQWAIEERSWRDLNIQCCLLCKCSSGSAACLLVPKPEHRLQMNNSSSTDERGLPTQLEAWPSLASLWTSCHCLRGFKLTFMTYKEPDFPRVIERSVLALLGWKPYGINFFATVSKHIYLTDLLCWPDAHLEYGYVHKNVFLKTF